MRLRSILRISAGGPLEEALASPADAIALTLADARYPVEQLREAAAAAIARLVESGKRALVTVNHPRTQLLRADLEAVVRPGLGGVLLPHTVEPQDVRDLAVLLREFEYDRAIEPGEVIAIPVIDTARGLLRAAEIVHAAPRVAGLLLDAEAYAWDVGARAEEKGPRLAYPRGAVVAAARAFEKLPLVTSSGLELQFLAQHGFAGAVMVDARHVANANQLFAPGEFRVGRAKAEAAAYDAAKAAGAWVAREGETVIDAHSARKARALE